VDRSGLDRKDPSFPGGRAILFGSLRPWRDTAEVTLLLPLLLLLLLLSALDQQEGEAMKYWQRRMG